MDYTLRNFMPEDTAAVNRLALAAFKEYQSVYSDWAAFSKHIGDMAGLAAFGELIVATKDDTVLGAVVYVGPDRPKAPIFDPTWAIIRMLAVQPESRGSGIGRTLTEECICRARRDRASCIALHTTPVMRIALEMYQRMGFEFFEEVPPIFGVPYDIYLKQIK